MQDLNGAATIWEILGTAAAPATAFAERRMGRRLAFVAAAAGVPLHDPRLAERLQAWAVVEHKAAKMAQRVLNAVDRAA